MTRTMYDCSTPVVYTGYDVVAGYAGGDTPYVWQSSDWQRMISPGKLPIWTHSFVGSEGQVDAQSMLDYIHSIWGTNLPAGFCVAIDLEANVDPGYVQSFDQVIQAAGGRTLAYGQASTIFQNPMPSGGYWAAYWSPSAGDVGNAAVVQYANQGAIDVNYIYDGELVFIGDPNPAPAPVPTPTQDDDMPQQIDGTVVPGTNPTVVASPSGAAWTAYPNRTLHLVLDSLVAGAETAQVRVALFDAAHEEWTLIEDVELDAAKDRSTLNYPVTVTKVSLQTSAVGVGYGIEVW